MSGTYPSLPTNMVDVMAEMQEKLPFIEPMALELLQREGSIEAAIDEVARDKARGDIKELALWVAKDDNVFFVEELYDDETNPFDTLKDLFKEARYDFNVELLKEALSEGELSEYLAFRSLARQGFAAVSEEVAKDVCVNAIDVLHTDSFEEFDRIASEAIGSAKARESREGTPREAYTFEEARHAFGAERQPGAVVRKVPERGGVNATPAQDERTARSQAALAPVKENPKPNRTR